jgi:hypothetical protein
MQKNKFISILLLFAMLFIGGCGTKKYSSLPSANTPIAGLKPNNASYSITGPVTGNAEGGYVFLPIPPFIFPHGDMTNTKSGSISLVGNPLRYGAVTSTAVYRAIHSDEKADLLIAPQIHKTSYYYPFYVNYEVKVKGEAVKISY